MGTPQDISDILKFMQTGTPDLEGCAVVSEDGLMIASAFPSSYDEGRLAGMTATLLSLGAKAAEEMERGRLEEFYIKGDRGYAIVMHANEGSVFLALTNPQANLGLIFMDIRRCLNQIRKVL